MDFLYDQGYEYHESEDVPGANPAVGYSRAKMNEQVAISELGWEEQQKAGVPRTYEGWWELAARRP